MKQITTFLSVALMVLLMTSCGLTDAKVYVDNPTNEPITISIDGKDAITIASKKYETIDNLPQGDHKIKIGEKEFDFKVEASTIMLNPTFSTYVFAKGEYGVGEESEDNYTVIEIDDSVYEGPFILDENNVSIDISKAHFDVLTPFPSEITISGNGVVVRSKIFRKADFFQYYEDEYTE